MFSFNSLAEFLTSNGRYCWFYFPVSLVERLDVVEKDEIFIEPTNDLLICRVWYPKRRYYERPIDQEELQRMLSLAIEKEDWIGIKQIKERMKQCKVG